MSGASSQTTHADPTVTAQWSRGHATLLPSSCRFALLCVFLVGSSGCSLFDDKAHFFEPGVSPDVGLPAPDVALPNKPQKPIYTGPSSCDDKRCDDGISCTVDTCVDGRCKNILEPGKCLIDNRCYQDGEAVGGTCEICAPRVSVSLKTFASGAPCDDGRQDTVADTCLTGGCRGFSKGSFAISPEHVETTFQAVASVPRSTAVWAVGRQRRGGAHPGGFVTRLAGSATPSATMMVAHPLEALHENLAVGLGGEALLYRGGPQGGWVRQERLIRSVGGMGLFSVWAARTGSLSEYYLAGDRGRLLRCISANSGQTFSCQPQQGLGGRLVSVRGFAVGQASALWALRGDGRQDIFYGDLLSPLWSTTAPRGCADDPGALGACVDARGAFLDLWVGSPDDAWAVGEAGIVMRFDGLRWTRVKIPTLTVPSQASYTFRGIWGSSEVVILVGERLTAETWDLVAVMYNRRLDRWYNVRPLLMVPDVPIHRASVRINDIGGRGEAQLYLVGSHFDDVRGQRQGLLFSRIVTP